MPPSAPTSLTSPALDPNVGRHGSASSGVRKQSRHSPLRRRQRRAVDLTPLRLVWDGVAPGRVRWLMVSLARPGAVAYFRAVEPQSAHGKPWEVARKEVPRRRSRSAGRWRLAGSSRCGPVGRLRRVASFLLDGARLGVDQPGGTQVIEDGRERIHPHARGFSPSAAQHAEPPKGAPMQRPAPTTTQRGYGAHHQALRRQYEPKVAAGTADCPYCGGPIVAGEAWDLARAADRRHYLGPAHAKCNRRARSSREW